MAKLFAGCDIQVIWQYDVGTGRPVGHAEAVVGTTGIGGFSTYGGSSINDHNGTGGERDVDGDGALDSPVSVSLLCACP